MQRKLCVALACAKIQSINHHTHDNMIALYLQRFKASSPFWDCAIFAKHKLQSSFHCDGAAPRIMMSYMQSGTQICSYCYHETFFEIEKWKILLNAVARWDLLSDIYNHVTGCYKPAVLNHATTKTNYAWGILQVQQFLLLESKRLCKNAPKTLQKVQTYCRDQRSIINSSLWEKF